MTLDTGSIIAVGAGALGVYLWSQKDRASTLASENAPTLIVAIGIAAFLLFRNFDQSPNKPTPTSTTILAGVFATNDNADDAAKDAGTFAALCYALADGIEQDSKLSTPFFKFGTQYDDIRRRARTYLFGGNSLAPKYPALAEKVNDHLQKVVGDDGGPVTAEKRKDWAKGFRDLGDAAKEEAGRL